MFGFLAPHARLLLTSFLSSGDAHADAQLREMQVRSPPSVCCKSPSFDAQASPAFWELACQMVMEPGNPDAQFFVLNMLYSKVIPSVHSTRVVTPGVMLPGTSRVAPSGSISASGSHNHPGREAANTAESTIMCTSSQTCIPMNTPMSSRAHSFPPSGHNEFMCRTPGRLDSFSPLLLRRACLILAVT